MLELDHAFFLVDDLAGAAGRLEADGLVRSPAGLALRGRPGADELPAFWPYDALGIRIWIHRDNEDQPERPMVFSLELAVAPDGDALEVAEGLTLRA